MVLSGATMFRRYDIQDNDIQRTTFSLLTHKNFLYVAANNNRKYSTSGLVSFKTVILIVFYFIR